MHMYNSTGEYSGVTCTQLWNILIPHHNPAHKHTKCVVCVCVFVCASSISGSYIYKSYDWYGIIWWLCEYNFCLKEAVLIAGSEQWHRRGSASTIAPWLQQFWNKKNHVWMSLSSEVFHGARTASQGAKKKAATSWSCKATTWLCCKAQHGAAKHRLIVLQSTDWLCCKAQTDCAVKHSVLWTQDAGHSSSLNQSIVPQLQRWLAVSRRNNKELNVKPGVDVNCNQLQQHRSFPFSHSFKKCLVALVGALLLDHCTAWHDRSVEPLNNVDQKLKSIRVTSLSSSFPSCEDPYCFDTVCQILCQSMWNQTLSLAQLSSQDLSYLQSCAFPEVKEAVSAICLSCGFWLAFLGTGGGGISGYASWHNQNRSK